VKKVTGFARIEMKALSNGKSHIYPVKEENASWKTITIERVAVKRGKVKIGFHSEGTANAFCYVDDMTLVKIK